MSTPLLDDRDDAPISALCTEMWAGLSSDGSSNPACQHEFMSVYPPTGSIFVVSFTTVKCMFLPREHRRRLPWKMARPEFRGRVQ